VSISLNPTMHNIARAALLNVLGRSMRDMEEVFKVVGMDLSDAERAAIVDYSAAAERLAKTLDAEEL
jgi:hypothetical protein